MKKGTPMLIVSFIIGILEFTRVGYGINANQSVTMERLSQNVLIGEIFSSGFVYIEPFRIDRKGDGQEIKISRYPHRICFFPCNKDKQVKYYVATFDSVFRIYVPNCEKGSRYFFQPYSEAVQSGLRYKTETGSLCENSKLGIASCDNNISSVDYAVKGRKRPYSDSEYHRTVNEVREDQKIKESERTLDFITMEDTIVGAKQILLIYFSDKPFTMRLSQYSTHNFEYAATVYVLDILKDGKVVKTYEKHNWDGPY